MRLTNEVETFTLKLSSPITEEEWDIITDVDFDKTDHIYFHTKNGKEVYFYKRRAGQWVPFDLTWGRSVYRCTCCKEAMEVPFACDEPMFKYCPNCGAYMEGTE